MENNLELLKLLGIDLPYDAAVLLIQKEMKTYVQKMSCTQIQIFVSALFVMSRIGERLIMSTS